MNLGHALSVGQSCRTSLNDVGDGHNVEVPKVFGPLHFG